ncbi:MAG: hypothetical protein ACJ76H_07170 [Bacteriovoracaceae bacterium]
MKKIIFIAALMSLTTSAFAVQYCTIKGTSETAGIFPGDSSREASIYIEGHGYFKITAVDDNYEVYTSKKRGEDTVVLDFKNRTLTMGSQQLKLVKCVQNGSE